MTPRAGLPRAMSRTCVESLPIFTFTCCSERHQDTDFRGRHFQKLCEDVSIESLLPPPAILVLDSYGSGVVVRNGHRAKTSQFGCQITAAPFDQEIGESLDLERHEIARRIQNRQRGWGWWIGG